MTKALTLLLPFFIFQFAQAQIGGSRIYQFLDLPSSPRITALGESLIAVKDADIALAYGNPAALDASMHGRIALSTNLYIDDIKHGSIAYGHHVDSLGLTLHGGIHYITYGDFIEANEFGDQIGEFSAKEIAIFAGAGYQLYDRLSLGANIKFISSRLESYSSFGIAGDAAATYFIEESNFTATLAFRNFGRQFSTYAGEREKLPFDIQLGISKRLKHLPFRFSVTYHHLNNWNILYDDPNSEEDVVIIGEESSDPGSQTFDQFFRHLIFSGEFLFGQTENFNIRFGYNHLRKQELSLNNFRSLAGFSLGAGIKIRRIKIDYGMSIFHLGGSTAHLGISTSIGEFKKTGAVID